MADEQSKTLRLVMPQWQGGDNLHGCGRSMGEHKPDDDQAEAEEAGQR